MLDLQQFCNAEEERAFLRQPYSYGNHTYATDGALMVRVERRAEAPEAARPKLGEYSERLFKSAVAFVNPPAFAIPADVEASNSVECDSCEGRGYEHDCPSCACGRDDCGGSGQQKRVDKISTEFLGNLYRLKYVRQMLALPGIEIAPASVNEKERMPLNFRFDGGEGALLPLTSKYPRHVQLSEKEPA